MARLYSSDIRLGRRKHTANARKAVLYRRMAEAIAAQDEATIVTMPKYVPRGHAPDWYLARATSCGSAISPAGAVASR